MSEFATPLTIQMSHGLRWDIGALARYLTPAAKTLRQLSGIEYRPLLAAR